MGYFRIYQDGAADFTVVSNRFIDDYMAEANDAQLKIYLYLLRMLSADLATGISDIADRFNYTEKDVIRALDFWAKKGVLKLDRDASDEVTGVHMISLAPGTSATAMQTPVQASEPLPAEASYTQSADTAASSGSAPIISIRDYSKPQYTGDDLVSFKEQPNSSQIIFVAEQYLRRPLSQSDITTLMFILDQLHFSDDLVDYLLQYCVDKGKTHHKYIETVALNWAQSGITTPTQAAAYVSRYNLAYDIMRALGKNNTDPSTVELQYIDRWTNTFGYDMSVIGEACARTVLNTEKARFKYADSILTKWYKLGIRNKADIDRLDPQITKQASDDSSSGAGKNKFNQFNQNSYDFDELEKKLISN